MKLVDAIQRVLELARQRMRSDSPTFESDTDACNTVEDFAVNHLGED